MPPQDDAAELAALDLFERSLDELSPNREAWIRAAAGDDTRLAAAALALLKEDTRTEGAIRTGGAQAVALETPPPDRIGPYRIDERIGAGGMGAVYRGEREGQDFEQTVAIKIIRPGVLSDELVQRFQTERRTMARLRHPNIAQLYDGGTLPSGVPYIIMEYVDGSPLLGHVETNNLNLAQRLALFKDACRAVAFAHQNLVIHRDLTPANVLVTKDGVAKLIDFGIARPPAPKVQLEAAAHLTYTPGYAAPERALGESSTTLTDIYSLGVLLRDLMEGLTAPPDLAAIADKAAAEAPGDRYPSVTLLLQDLDRFSGGYPVSARKGQLYRFMTFIRRRKLIVGASTAAAVALVAALVATLISRAETDTARRNAEARLEQVRSLSGFMMFDLFDEIGELPLSTAVRARMAGWAQSYLDSLRSVPGATPALEIEIMEGYRRLGDVLGNPQIPNLGDRAGARAAYARAQAIADALPPAVKSGPDGQFALGKLAYSQSVLALYADFQTAKARELAQRSVDLIDASARAAPSASRNFWRASARESLMDIDSKDATVDPRLSDRTAEMKGILDTIDFSDPSLKLFERRIGKAMLASLPANLAEAAYRAKNFDKAIALGGQAIDQFEALMRETSENRYYLKRAALLHLFRFGVYAETGRMEEALADSRAAIAYADRYAALDPADDEARFVSEGIRAPLYAFLAIMLKDREALKQLQAVAASRRQQMEADAGSTKKIYDYAVMLRPIGDAMWNLKRMPEACDLYREAQGLFDRMDKAAGLSAYQRENEYRKIRESVDACQ